MLNNQESYWQLNIYFFLLGLKHAKILANNLIIDPKSKKKKIRFTFDNQVNLNETINKKDHFCIVDSTSTTTIIYLFINISISFLYREHKIRSKTQKRELKICINERPHKNLSTERKNYLKGMAHGNTAGPVQQQQRTRKETILTLQIH